VHYLHSPGFDAQAAQMLADMVERSDAAITFHEVAGPRLDALPSQSRFTAAMWHRFFLPELLDKGDKLLYLDADTIVCSSLKPLWRTNLSGYWLGAVTNVFQPNHRARPKSLGLPSRDVYFNSGVLLMNLAEMRRDRITDRLLALVAERGKEFEWPDQDALNLVLGERRLRLHPRWNATNALRQEWSKGTFERWERQRALHLPSIRHFEGPDANKPWHPNCAERQRKLYWKHRHATPFHE
jgi:lipopolysaccharide biosynthesis glycosyltransferase